jgi:hypothetical protein
MKATYRVLAILVLVIVALQAAFIAMGVFGLGSYVEDGHDFTKSALDSNDSSVTGSIGFALHNFGAIAIALIALVLLVVAFFAKIPGGVRWALFIVGDVILQWVLAFVSFGVWAVGALHALNAFVLFGLGMAAAAKARRAEAVPDNAAPARAETV